MAMQIALFFSKDAEKECAMLNLFTGLFGESRKTYL